MRSGADGGKLTAVDYELLSHEWDGGHPIQDSEAPRFVSSGALPAGAFTFENMARWWLGDQGEPITYQLVLSKPGYVTKTMDITYMPGELTLSVTAILALDLPKVCMPFLRDASMLPRQKACASP